MRLLIIGGTRFLGRHLADAALARGHTLTLFNRGKSGPDLFPQLEQVHGDRASAGDLAALRGRTWDAVIDTCGYVPGIVRLSAEALAGAAGQYVFISTISAYRDSRQPNADESYPLASMPAEDAANVTANEQVTGENYGPLKALCEHAVTAAFPGRALIPRPGLIVGPHDPTDRFTYWVRRVAQGGRMLVPDTFDQAWQVIDARDLAAWIVAMVERGAAGAYNATGPDRVLTFGEVLDTCRHVSASDVEFVPASESFLIENQVANWEALPLWLPSTEPDIAGFYSSNCARAIAAGLIFRPFEETVRETLEWDRSRTGGLKVGLTREHETELLARWAQRIDGGADGRADL